MPNIIYKEESYKIQGAIFKVYKEMGSGFLEAVYQECLEKEMKLQHIPFISQPVLELNYKGEKLEQTHGKNSLIEEIDYVSSLPLLP